MRHRRIAYRHHIGRYVARDAGVVCDEGMSADLAVLVHRDVAAQDGPVPELHVPGDHGEIDHDHVIADHAVMRHVRVGHEQIIAAYTGDALVENGATTDGAVLADHVAIPDPEPRRLAQVLLVLWRLADRGELKDLVVL